MSGGGRAAFVLLHAFGSAGKSYEPVSRLLPKDQPLLAPDLPGFGGAPELTTPSVAAYADWTVEAVARAGLSRVVLGGWSMGGKIAMALAARRPPWLAGLVLIAPSPPSPEPMDEADRQRQTDGLGDRALAETSVRDLVAEETPPAWVQGEIDSRISAAPGAWRWWLQAGSREDLDLGPKPLDTPALVVVGTKDANLGAETQARLTLPRLAQGRLERIEGCGHFLPLEAPERLGRHIESWTASLPLPG